MEIETNSGFLKLETALDFAARSCEIDGEKEHCGLLLHVQVSAGRDLGVLMCFSSQLHKARNVGFGMRKTSFMRRKWSSSRLAKVLFCFGLTIFNPDWRAGRLCFFCY